MKTILQIISFLVFPILWAQEPSEKLTVEKGTRNLTGSLALSFQNNENSFNQSENSIENSSNAFVIAPSFGYALKENLLIGVSLEYNNSKTKQSSFGFESNTNSEFTNESIGLLPFIRVYKGIGKQLALYLQGEMGYSRFWNKNQRNDEIENNDTTGNNLFIGVRPGITYFLNKNWAVEANYGSLGYSFTERKSDSGDYSKNTAFNASLNASDLFFGLAYYF